MNLNYYFIIYKHDCDQINIHKCIINVFFMNMRIKIIHIKILFCGTSICLSDEHHSMTNSLIKFTDEGFSIFTNFKKHL